MLSRRKRDNTRGGSHYEMLQLRNHPPRDPLRDPAAPLTQEGNFWRHDQTVPLFRQVAHLAAHVIHCRLPDLLGRIHDERSLADDGFIERFTRQ